MRPLAEATAGWLLIRLRVPVERAEILAAELWDLGALGLEETEPQPGEAELSVFFPPAGPEPEGFAPVVAAARARVTERTLVPPADWLARYRELSRPLPLGRGFLADPRDADDADAAAGVEGRRTLRLPARTAFGTGSHESTRLAVELLEDDPPEGERVLDVGTGSGVLAYVALALGARHVVALDVDPAASLVAGQIAALNDLSPSLLVGDVSCLRSAPLFDRILVNIIPAHWLPAGAALAGLLAPAGRLVVSGLLGSQREEVAGALASLGLSPVAERTDGEWLGLRMVRGPGTGPS
ncbi:MAG: 50S ribosomal protein L11 methyltransferase [Thermoanaerobaculia bacterium]